MTQSIAPSISVIVCAYNGAKVIQSCLQSLIEQTASVNSYEVIIIDDESNDRTFEVAADFVDEQNGNILSIRLVRIRHGGLSIARNTGLFLAKGEIVAYIDQDAVADKNWVSEILKAWKAVPDADVIGGQVRARNIANQTAHFLFLVYYEPIEKNAIIGTNMTFKKERLLEVGAFGDPFACRGDETFLFYKMGSDHKEVKWSQAIVFHDWPVSIRQWLKERISNGEMHRLITRILEDRKSLFKVFLFKRLSIIAIAIFLGALLPPKFMWGIIFVLFVFLLRGIRHGTFKMCKDNYPFIAVLFLPLLWQVLNEIGEWLFHIGRWRGYRIPFDKSCALKGTLEDKNIIQVVVNH